VDAFLEHRRAEIDQQADPQIQKPQIRQQLFCVNGRGPLDRLDLHGHLPSHQQIGPESILEHKTFVFKRHRPLPLDNEPLAREVARQNDFVDRLEKAWAEFRVEFESRIDNRAGDIVERRLPALRVLRVPNS
jgi:hypothetical protein